MKPSPSKDRPEPCELRVGKTFIPDQVWPRGEVPECVLASPALSLGARLCYVVMARLGRISGRCYASESTLAAMISRTKRQVQRYLEELRRRRYIRGKPRVAQPTVWQFLWRKSFPHVASASMDKSVTPPTTKLSRGGRQKCRGGVDKDVHQTLRSNHTKGTVHDDDARRPAPAATAETPELSRAIQHVIGRPDPRAAAQIAAGCRVQTPDVTDAELAHFTALWLPELFKQKNLRNPLGMLITQMPTWIAGALPEHREQLEQERVRAERQRQETLRMWQQMLDDPKSSDADRQLARRMLSGAGPR